MFNLVLEVQSYHFRRHHFQILQHHKLIRDFSLTSLWNRSWYRLINLAQEHTEYNGNVIRRGRSRMNYLSSGSHRGFSYVTA